MGSCASSPAPGRYPAGRPGHDGHPQGPQALATSPDPWCPSQLGGWPWQGRRCQQRWAHSQARGPTWGFPKSPKLLLSSLGTRWVWSAGGPWGPGRPGGAVSAQPPEAPCQWLRSCSWSPPACRPGPRGSARCPTCPTLGNSSLDRAQSHRHVCAAHRTPDSNLSPQKEKAPWGPLGVLSINPSPRMGGACLWVCRGQTEASLWTRPPAVWGESPAVHTPVLGRGPAVHPPWVLQPVCALSTGSGHRRAPGVGTAEVAWPPCSQTAARTALSSPCPPRVAVSGLSAHSDHTSSRPSSSAALGASGWCPLEPVHSAWTPITKCPPLAHGPRRHSCHCGTREPCHADSHPESTQSCRVRRRKVGGFLAPLAFGDSDRGDVESTFPRPLGLCGDLVSSLGTWSEVPSRLEGNRARRAVTRLKSGDSPGHHLPSSDFQQLLPLPTEPLVQ